MTSPARAAAGALMRARANGVEVVVGHLRSLAGDAGRRVGLGRGMRAYRQGIAGSKQGQQQGSGKQAERGHRCVQGRWAGIVATFRRRLSAGL